jgi:hypothetical protein
MARAISVKVSRVKVIEALRNKLSTMALEREEYLRAEEQYEEDHKAWKENLANQVLVHFPKVDENSRSIHFRSSYYGDKKIVAEISVTFSEGYLPEEPKRPENPHQSHGYGRDHVGGYDDRVREINNAINLLLLSDEEVVNTSTYNSVSRYL